MGPPPIDVDSRANLLWALWHNIDPAELLAAAAEERADTISVESYEVPYKYTPSYAFPSRRSQYADVTRVKAQQNVARTQYCSTASDNVQSTVTDDKMAVLAKPSTRECGILRFSVS